MADPTCDLCGTLTTPRRCIVVGGVPFCLACHARLFADRQLQHAYPHLFGRKHLPGHKATRAYHRVKRE